MQFEENNNEEADTLMIGLAAAASQRCPKAQMVFFSPDIDVLVLAVAHYDKLCKHTAICMVSGTLETEPIWNALGQDKGAALPVFHAFTGADSVGGFSGLGKNQVVSTVHKGSQGHHLSTDETDRRRPNAGGEGCIGQLCMLTVLPKGHAYIKYS